MEVEGKLFCRSCGLQLRCGRCGREATPDPGLPGWATVLMLPVCVALGVIVAAAIQVPRGSGWNGALATVGGIFAGTGLYRFLKLLWLHRF